MSDLSHFSCCGGTSIIYGQIIGVDRTADPSSCMDKLKNCWTSAVLWTLLGPPRAIVHKTADLSSFMDTFRPPLKISIFCVHRTADLSSFMDTFPTVSIKLLSGKGLDRVNLGRKGIDERKI